MQRKRKRKIRNLQTNDEEKETERSKEERTFEIFSTNGRNAQNGRRSKVEITTQVDQKKEKEGKQFSNRDD